MKFNNIVEKTLDPDLENWKNPTSNALWFLAIAAMSNSRLVTSLSTVLAISNAALALNQGFKNNPIVVNARNRMLSFFQQPAAKNQSGTISAAVLLDPAEIQREREREIDHAAANRPSRSS